MKMDRGRSFALGITRVFALGINNYRSVSRETFITIALTTKSNTLYARKRDWWRKIRPFDAV